MAVSKTPILCHTGSLISWICPRCETINTIKIDECYQCGDELSEKDVKYRAERIELMRKDYNI